MKLNRYTCAAIAMLWTIYGTLGVTEATTDMQMAGIGVLMVIPLLWASHLALTGLLWYGVLCLFVSKEPRK